MDRVPKAAPQTRVMRYNDGAVFLHWLTAVVVVAQVAVGFAFANMDRGPARASFFTTHKTLGALILVLALIRLAWRLANPPPPYPPELSHWERIAGVWNHRLFYILLVALPLTGLLAVSGGASPQGRTTTPLLGGVPLPLIPGVSDDAGSKAGSAHIVLVFITLALLALHIAAAIKHQAERNRAAGRMPPFRAASERAVPRP